METYRASIGLMSDKLFCPRPYGGQMNGWATPDSIWLLVTDAAYIALEPFRNVACDHLEQAMEWRIGLNWSGRLGRSLCISSGLVLHTRPH